MKKAMIIIEDSSIIIIGTIVLIINIFNYYSKKRMKSLEENIVEKTTRFYNLKFAYSYKEGLNKTSPRKKIVCTSSIYNKTRK